MRKTRLQLLEHLYQFCKTTPQKVERKAIMWRDWLASQEQKVRDEIAKIETERMQKTQKEKE